MERHRNGPKPDGDSLDGKIRFETRDWRFEPKHFVSRSNFPNDSRRRRRPDQRGTAWRIGIAAGISVVVLSAAGLYGISKARCFAVVGEAICHVDTNAQMVALTLDDAPTKAGDETALRALDRFHSHATFFAVGAGIPGNEELIRQIVASGNEVGNHSYSHKRMIFRSSAFYSSEIDRTDALLRAAGVSKPDLFRPPYGKKIIGLPRALQARGYKMIMWDVEDPRSARTPQQYADQIVAQARPGSIILMHVMSSSNGLARAALPLVLSRLVGRGFRVVTVSDLLKNARESRR
jgi:peptidoglycan/xylan/chitin deacetylase (PgdA/CDA1 family)